LARGLPHGRAASERRDDSGDIVFVGGIDAFGFDTSVPERVVKLVEPDGVTRTTSKATPINEKSI
jgi:hypothetical protein